MPRSQVCKKWSGAVSEQGQAVIDSYHQRLNAASVKGPKPGRFKCTYPDCTTVLRTKRGRNSHYTQAHNPNSNPPPQNQDKLPIDYVALRRTPMRPLPKLGYPKPLQPEAPREYKSPSPSMLVADVTIKSCPRCGGDMAYSYDQYGPDVHCLQCGHRI